MKYLFIFLLTIITAHADPYYALTTGNPSPSAEQCMKVLVENIIKKSNNKQAISSAQIWKRKYCIVYSQEIEKAEKEFIDGAKELGVLLNHNQKPSISIGKLPIYSKKTIKIFTKSYIEKKTSININKYDLSGVKFSKESQLWNLFYMCKPAKIMPMGCHFTIVVDNEKTPGFGRIFGK